METVEGGLISRTPQRTNTRENTWNVVRMTLDFTIPVAAWKI